MRIDIRSLTVAGFMMVMVRGCGEAQAVATTKLQAINDARYFERPLAPRVDELSVRGLEEAPITLVLYTDFECPFCKKGFTTINALRQKYGEDIKVVYKNMPSVFHGNAMIAAKYFEALKLQNKVKAFRFFDELLKRQARLKQGGENYLRELSRQVGADMNKLSLDVNSKEVLERIKKDLQEAKMFNFAGSPGFIVNGIPVSGALPESHFVQIIEQLKKRKIIQI